eukprot:CAMPEP_0176460890 /NCGR_PEP_ID=MMETSP0127-20121128/34293_1 /TAXON_ID=938130 /ORGANISM="Platyophrya macrostoma, Strain WH" /LENGTH=44 /DNA_ID= /DNA_START= /DNA_END= /DNA_ORIENTATION=
MVDAALNEILQTLPEDPLAALAAYFFKESEKRQAALGVVKSSLP